MGVMIGYAPMAYPSCFLFFKAIISFTALPVISVTSENKGTKVGSPQWIKDIILYGRVKKRVLPDMQGSVSFSTKL